MSTLLASIAVPVPLYRSFDYRLGGEAPRRGARVQVPFGRRQLVGIVVGSAREAADEADYKAIDAVLDLDAPLLNPELMTLCEWSAGYYQHPLGEVLAAALPGRLRHGAAAELAPPPQALMLTDAGRTALATMPARHRAQRALLERLARQPQAVVEVPAAQRRRLLDAGWATLQALAPAVPDVLPPTLTAEQDAALTALRDGTGFRATLLEGVTGSGKTELYLRLIADQIAAGRQVLVLAPEISLTPQLLARFRERLGAHAVVGFHSGLPDREREQAWLAAREGRAPVVVGTRSAVFVPFARLGLVIVDEEHDGSYKQQDGFRYSARDVAVVRAQKLDVPVVLGTATPSLETLHNARAGRYRHVRLLRRVQDRAPPAVRLLDLRGQHLDHGLSTPLLDAVERCLAQEGQALLFLNRRGFAPLLLCHDCGWTAPCAHCDARMTLHRGRGLIVCHHCGTQAPAPRECPSCGNTDLRPIGQGTERVEQALMNRFPRHRVERFDSDRVTTPAKLAQLLDDIRAKKIHVLVGTQILAKGHDFPGLSLVGIVSADQALYGTDFRAIERMGQLVTQVAGRAGRAETPGEVWLQTHEPEHPLLQTLVKQGYGALCERLLAEREMASLPPFAHLALLRAESTQPQAALRFLHAARAQLPAVRGVEVMEPISAGMERRAGFVRAQLLLQSTQRSALHRLLAQALPQLASLREGRGVRWSVDVDPGDLF